MYFQIVGEIVNVETFATGFSIRELPRLQKFYGEAAGENAKELRASD